MFKKLLDGELSLKDTFWKFGVVGLVFVNMLVRISVPCWLRNSTA